MKTILITAYAINPYKGSEDGTGWNIAYEIAKDFNVILITRKNNVPHLDRYFDEHPNDEHLKRIRYTGYDLRDWVLKIKKSTGTKSHVVYYYLWQWYVARFIQTSSFEFDLVHCLNFHSDSHPHFLWKFKKPVLWGPIGHHPVVPWKFIKNYRLRSILTDRLFYSAKWCMRHLNPYYRKAIRSANRILVINSSIQSVIDAPHEKTIILPAVASPIQLAGKAPRKHSFSVLSAGRFHFMKGFDVAIRSFSRFLDSLPAEDRNNVKLTLVGKGPERERLLSIVKNLKIESNVEWIEWVKHKEMARLYQSSDVFLFPSHEGAGMVVPEAMSYGLPVLAFNNYGPGELVGEKDLLIDYDTYENATQRFAEKLEELYQSENVRKEIGERLRKKQQRLLTWKHKGNIIRSHIHELLTY